MLSLSPVTFKPGDAASFVAVFHPDAKQEPNGNWLVSCPCPTHGKGRGDRNPSLSIKQGDKGIVFTCFAGDEFGAICDAYRIKQEQTFKPDDKPHTNGNSERRQVGRTEYIYRDEQGRPLSRKVRVDYDDGSKSYPQDRWENGRWVSRLSDDTRRVLYRLPELIQADPMEPVYFVEGEKCADRLARDGLVVTTTGGVKTWRDEFAPYFKGRVVIILPDNDDEGSEYARQVSISLDKVVCWCAVVPLLGLPPKGDVYDWLAAGHTVAELEDMVARWQAEDTWEPDPEPHPDEPSTNGYTLPHPPIDLQPIEPERPLRFPLIPARDMRNRPPQRWLIKNELPVAQVVMLFGPSTAGKSFVAVDWSFNIGQDHLVIYVAAEDPDGYTPRMIAWCNHHKKDEGHVHFVDRRLNLFNYDDVRVFIEEIAPAQPALIIFDTLAKCMTGADENSARDVGVVIENLEAICDATGATIVAVHHTGKDGSSYRGSSRLFNDLYTVIELDNNDGLITVKGNKAKNSPEYEPRKLRLLQVETGRLTEDGELETSCVVIPSHEAIQETGLKGNQRRILEVLAWETFVSTGAKSAVIGKTLGLEGASLYTPLGKLLARGYARQATKGDPYYITDTGLVAINGSVADRENSTLLYYSQK